jgi:hypothetical protein
MEVYFEVSKKNRIMNLCGKMIGIINLVTK